MGKKLMYMGLECGGGIGGSGTGDMSASIYDSELDVASEGGIPGFVDAQIADKADKVTSATSGNFAGLDANGNLIDSGHKHSDYLTAHQDISGKADKVTSATSGNFAALDSNGNLTDSGHKHSDYLTQHQDISGKADKVSNATNGNFAGLDANGNLTDSGSKASDFLTQHQDISGKMNTNGSNAASDVTFGGSFTVGTRGSGTVGINSIAQGYQTVASGEYSHAEGYQTTASVGGQFVIGQRNDNKNNTMFEVGNGESGYPSNAFEVYQDGSLSTDNGATKHKLGILQVDPTDATFMATPGAIWIET